MTQPKEAKNLVPISVIRVPSLVGFWARSISAITRDVGDPGDRRALRAPSPSHTHPKLA
jgi:hypothetical protein